MLCNLRHNYAQLYFHGIKNTGLAHVDAWHWSSTNNSTYKTTVHLYMTRTAIFFKNLENDGDNLDIERDKEY